MLESTVTGGPVATASANIFETNRDYIVAESVYVGAPRGRDADTHAVRFTPNGSVDSTFNSPTFDFAGEGGSGHFDGAQDALRQIALDE